MTRSRISRTNLILLGLMVLAFGLDALFFTGFYASDDIQYLSGAGAIGGHGTFVPDIGNVRLGITLPSAVVWWITGSVGAVAWFHALYHPLLVVLAFLLGRVLHGERVGLVAAAFVATSPLLYYFAGAILPDNATACWLTASTIVLCTLRRSRTNEPPSKLRRLVGYFAAGALLGIAYTCKETTLIMTLAAAVFTMSGRPLRKLDWILDGAMIMLGLGLIMLAEHLVLRAISGEWISRLSFVSNNAADFRDYMSDQGTYPHVRLLYAADRLRALMPITLWMFIGAGIAYVMVRGRDLALAFAFWWPVLYMTIGSTQLTEYLPPTIQNRYYAIMIVPAAIMTAKLALDMLDRRRMRTLPMIALAFAAIVVIFEALRLLPDAGANYRSNQVRAFTAAVDEAHQRFPQHPIVITPYYQYRMAPLLKDTNFPAPAPGQSYMTVELLEIAELQVAEPPPNFEIQLLEVIPPPMTPGMHLADVAFDLLGIEKRRRSLAQRRRPDGAALILVTPRTP